MKKLLLSLLTLTATFTSFGQTSATIMPEIKLGYANVEIDDNADCFHFNVNLTLGITKQMENSRLTYGFVLGRNGYSHTETDEYDNVITTSAGGWLLGGQFLQRKNNGLFIGCLIGCTILDDEYTIYYDEDFDDYDLYQTKNRRGLTVKGKIGYGLDHFALLLEAGYSKGPEIGLNVAFPIFRKN